MEKWYVANNESVGGLLTPKGLNFYNRRFSTTGTKRAISSILIESTSFFSPPATMSRGRGKRVFVDFFNFALFIP